MTSRRGSLHAPPVRRCNCRTRRRLQRRRSLEHKHCRTRSRCRCMCPRDRSCKESRVWRSSRADKARRQWRRRPSSTRDHMRCSHRRKELNRSRRHRRSSSENLGGTSSRGHMRHRRTGHTRCCRCPGDKEYRRSDQRRLYRSQVGRKCRHPLWMLQ